MEIKQSNIVGYIVGRTGCTEAEAKMVADAMLASGAIDDYGVAEVDGNTVVHIRDEFNSEAAWKFRMTTMGLETMPKFCTIHGTALQPKVGDFDQYTGERRTYMVCRVCIPCDHEWVKLPRWNFMDYQCTKCGKKDASTY